MKKLLFSLMFVGISAITFNAQVWDIADATKFPASIAVPTTVDGLTFNGAAGSAVFATTSNSVSIGDYSATRRFQFGGNSYNGSTNPAINTTSLPTKKWVEVAVPNNYTIKIWGRGGGVRNILISDNTGLVLSTTPFAGNTTSDVAVISYKYTGTAPYLIISAGAGDNYIYKIEVTSGTLAVNDVKSNVKATAYSSGNKIYVANLESKTTDINVYSANGLLVKTLKSSSDINFDINGKGLYIVNLKSEAGEKSVKVLLK